MSTHSEAHSKAQMYPPKLNITGPCISLAHTFNTHTHTEHSYVPDMQAANGIYAMTIMAVCVCTHVSHLTGSQGTQNGLGATPPTYTQLFMPEIETGTL